MRLNPPTIFVFLISLVFIGLSIVSKQNLVNIPNVMPHQDYWLAVTAYFALMLGNLVRGL